mgnify:CR=1 FL=1
MFAKTAVARFRATMVARAVSPYAIFLKQTKGKFAGMPVAQRSRQIAKLWKALPVAEKKAIQKTAAAHRAFPKKVRKVRKANVFSLFVKKNYSKVKNVAPSQRLAAIAKLWKQAKKQ